MRKESNSLLTGHALSICVRISDDRCFHSIRIRFITSADNGSRDIEKTLLYCQRKTPWQCDQCFCMSTQGGIVARWKLRSEEISERTINSHACDSFYRWQDPSHRSEMPSACNISTCAVQGCQLRVHSKVEQNRSFSLVNLVLCVKLSIDIHHRLWLVSFVTNIIRQGRENSSYDCLHLLVRSCEV